MFIRKATTTDIPAIVELLKASLGEVSSAKSIAYWNWKHVDNPFGASPVLVAEEDGQLIGVRAFLRWDWREGDTTYRALRAVDTATHPAYQGKGIFKQLTLQLVEEATRDGFDFIFNSPNTQSTPGYLKMGWEVWGKMPLWMGVSTSFKKYRPDLFHVYHDHLQQAELNLVPLKQDYHKAMSTVLSPAFFQWRYRDCPVKPYGLKIIENEGNQLWLFFTVKEKKYGMELRICHSIFSNETDYRFLFQSVRNLSKELGCRFMTIAGLQALSALKTLGFGYVNASRLSVLITMRKLANMQLYSSLHHKKNWLLQTGDIELF